LSTKGFVELEAVNSNNNMNPSLSKAGSNFGLRRYEAILKQAADRLHELKPTSIIALARKGPRLLQMMQQMGIAFPAVSMYADHALDFLDPADIGERPVIFDDVTILGSSLFRLKRRLKTQFGLDAKVVAAAADTDNFQALLVPNLWSASWRNETATQEFSSELIRAIPLMGVPYDIDHPVFSFPRKEGLELLAQLAQKATSVHREDLTLQYRNDYQVLVLHFDFPQSKSLLRLTQVLGVPDICKIKVLDSRFQDEIRFVLVTCFPPLLKTHVEAQWAKFFPEGNLRSPLSKYRVLCFTAAQVIASAIDSRFSENRLLWAEAQLVLGRVGTALSRKLLLKICGDKENSAQAVSVLDLPTAEELAELGKCFEVAAEACKPELEGLNTYERLCSFWRNAFTNVELRFRSELSDSISKGFGVESIMDSESSKRLQSGVSSLRLRSAVESEANVEWSLAMDLAVDSGVQVPIYTETDTIVARAYHHGESVWDGMRLAALVAQVFDYKKQILQNVQRIRFEKWMVLLYDLATGQEGAMFAPVLHYLRNPLMEALSPSAIQVGDGYRQHGRTLEIAVTLQGLTADGEPRRSAGGPSVYWFEKQARVLASNPDGETIHLAPDAAKRSLYQSAIPRDVYTPVGMLFEFLAAKLPNQITLPAPDDNQVFDLDDILRLLSSCVTQRKYLRAIAEDAILVTQSRLKQAEGDQFWLSSGCRGPCGEIYQKWRVKFFSVKLLKALEEYCAANGLDDRFNLFVSPLESQDGETEPRGGRKIEHRCLTLFLCVESYAIANRRETSENKQKAIDWLRNHAYLIPDDPKGQTVMAEKVCEEIRSMFPALVKGLHALEDEAEDEFFVFSDMKDSSAPGEEKWAESAKEDFVVALRSLRGKYPTMHFNEDLNDEKDLCLPGRQAATETLSCLVRTYSAREKYGRIGMVSSLDTREKAKKPSGLPSSPTNYILAKFIASHLGKSDGKVGEINLRDLDKRRSGQHHGVFACCRTASELLDFSTVFGSGKKFDTLVDFLKSEDEGWVHVLDDSIEVGRPHSPKLEFSVFLYR
jgi:hypothetical protein